MPGSRSRQPGADGPGTCAGKTLEGRWAGRTVVLAASGPSFDLERVEFAKANDTPILAVNSTGLACRCDVLYASDYAWWQNTSTAQRHKLDARGTELWTCSSLAARQFDLLHIPSKELRGLSTDPSYLHSGHHSGFQALNIAFHAGAKRILLTGYDMRHVQGAIHWHGDHPSNLRNPRDALLRMMAQAYGHARKQLDARGVEVINCTPGSAIDAFPFSTLAVELGAA